MEEMHGLRLARAAPIEEERSACGGEARSTSSPASRMENYAEIFGGFAASCSIPVLVLPEAMNGYEEELAGSQNSCLNYLEMFGVLDAGTFSLSYEELFSMEKGSNNKDEEDDRFLDETDFVQVEAGPPELPVGGHITFSKVNQISSSFHLKFDAGKTTHQTNVDEVKNTICVSRPQANCGPDFEAETASPTGFVKVDSPTNVDAIVDGSENHLNDCDKPPSNNAAYDLKQHSHSSSHHLTSSGDIPLADYAFFTISDINLRTQPLEVPPPLRAPPKFKMKQGMSKSETLEAHRQAGGSHTRNALKETAIYCDMEVDARKAAAAMIEAMEEAQASLRSAKDFMERTRDGSRSDRRLGPHDFGFWNEQSTIGSGDSKHKAKKAQKVAHNQAESVNSMLFEDAEEAVQGEDSSSYKLSDEKDKPSEWIIDKQFYELVSSEKLIRNRVTNDETFVSDGDIKLEHQLDAYQYFSEKESCGSHGQRSLHGVDDNEDENKVLTIDAFKINENKMFSGVELQMQDGNAKQLKSGIINVSGLMGLCMDRKLAEFDGGETLEEMLDQVEEDISETTVAFDYGEFKSNVGTAHSSKADNRNVTSESGINKMFKENMEATREECQLGTLKQTKNETYDSYNEENSSFAGLDKASGPVKKQRAKWNIPSISELNVAKLFGQPVCLEKAKEALLEFQQNVEKNVYEPPHKFESYEGRLNADKKDEKKILGKVQAALELEKKIMGLSATQQVSAHHIFQRERNKEAEQKRKLEKKERVREREKDMISVEKATHEDCGTGFWEKPGNIVLERSEKVVKEAKLWVDCAVVERATAEAGESAIGGVIVEQTSVAARKQTETSGIVSNDKDWKYVEAKGIARAGDEDSDDDSKPSSDVHGASNDMKSQSEVLEGESPLRSKARQERCQRIVERAAKALAEKNMRDLLAQREQAERNRLAESLDAEIRRWSSGKEGNLRALLSTLQYILGHDIGWQPIPLTEVITAAAVRKAYRKATLYVHPDKLQQRGATIQHKYICEKVFDLLKDAWSKFNSEG